MGFLFAGHWKSSLGVMTGFFWLFLNTFFLLQLVQMSLTPKVKSKDKIFVITVLKFPVLYLIGFFILQSRFFPVISILAGLSIFLAVFLISWIWFNARNPKVVLILPFFLGSWTGDVFAAEHESSIHTTNFVSLIAHYVHGPAADFLKRFETLIFGMIVIAILSAVFYAASKNARMIPGRLQSACEAVVEGLNNFICGIIGPEGRKYTPFLGTLFLYILTMNLIGLVPLMKSNTANSMMLSGPVALPVPTTTVALAIIVFVAVQAIGIKKLGLVGYLDHMAGSPRDVFGFVMAPLMFPIHLIGELAKPFSLTFRLFSNIMGGHILVAVFIGMGVASFFIPFQAPFLIFEIAICTIQAFVFTLLSTVYIAMMMPPHEEDHQAVSNAH